MKKVLSNVTKYVFAAFGIAILGLLMSLTYQALGRVFPDSFVNQLWGMVLFDIAAIVWALAFVFHCETTGQYAVAIIGFLTGFLGTLLMVGAEVMLGQTLTPTNAQEVGRWLVYGFIGATVLHAALLYAHHYSGQEVRQRIDIGIARGEITTEAISQATKTLDAEKRALAANIRDEIIANVKRDLNIPILADPKMPFLPADPRRYEQALPSPIEDYSPVDDDTKRMYAPGTHFRDGTITPKDLNDPFWSEHSHHMSERYGTKEAGNQPSPFRGQPPE